MTDSGEEEDYWKELKAANKLMADLDDGIDATKQEQQKISVGFKAVRTMLKQVMGSRELDTSEYSPLPKGKTRHRRDLDQAQVEALKRLVGLEHLWAYTRDGHDQGMVMLKYHLTGQGLPSTRESLNLWLDNDTHEDLYMPKIKAANTMISSLLDPTGLQLEGEILRTITDGFHAIRDLLYESFEYKKSNIREHDKLVVSKAVLTEKQLAILASLAEMDSLWLYMGWTHHYLPHTLREIGLPLTFSVRMDQDNRSVQRSLRSFLDA